MPRLGLAGPSYTSRSQDVDAQRTVNLYPEIAESGRGKADVVLYLIPGLSEYVDVVTTPIRGIMTRGATTWVVAGTKVYEIDNMAGVTEYTTSVANDSNPVQMAASQDYVFLVSAGSGYTISGGDVTAISDGDFPANAHGAAYVDGYFITLTDDEPDKAYYSALNDPTSWDALSFVTLQASENGIIGLFVDHRDLWFFGSQLGQAFYNTGDADEPFLPRGGYICQQGLAAEFSIAAGDGKIFFLGQDKRGQGVVWETHGCNPQRISTHAVEVAIQAYSTISDAIGWCEQTNGHTFYWLTFPTADATWVFDALTGLWHERLYWNSGGGSYEAHRAKFHTMHAGLHLVADKSTGQIYEMSTSYQDDDGDAIRILRRAPWISVENRRIVHSLVELDVETGTAGSEPSIGLAWSDDGGRTFTTPAMRSVGASAEYRKRVRWRRLGSSRGRIYELTSTDAAPWALIDCYLNLRPGAH